MGPVGDGRGPKMGLLYALNPLKQTYNWILGILHKSPYNPSPPLLCGAVVCGEGRAVEGQRGV